MPASRSGTGKVTASTFRRSGLFIAPFSSSEAGAEREWTLFHAAHVEADRLGELLVVLKELDELAEPGQRLRRKVGLCATEQHLGETLVLHGLLVLEEVLR